MTEDAPQPSIPTVQISRPPNLPTRKTACGFSKLGEIRRNKSLLVSFRDGKKKQPVWLEDGKEEKVKMRENLMIEENQFNNPREKNRGCESSPQ